jgi:hypothetical protein
MSIVFPLAVPPNKSINRKLTRAGFAPVISGVGRQGCTMTVPALCCLGSARTFFLFWFQARPARTRSRIPSPGSFYAQARVVLASHRAASASFHILFGLLGSALAQGRFMQPARVVQ